MEHMQYLIDNGYTDDAGRLADHQFETGLRMAKWYTGNADHLPAMVQAGINAGLLQAEYRDAAETTAGLLSF